MLHCLGLALRQEAKATQHSFRVTIICVMINVSWILNEVESRVQWHYSNIIYLALGSNGFRLDLLSFRMEEGINIQKRRW